jgi:hypothetical protein
MALDTDAHSEGEVPSFEDMVQTYIVGLGL